jgi:hypothetical protein
MAERRDTDTARPTWLGRLRLWWTATCEIRDLTRDAAREDAVLDAMATHLTPGPWALGVLFRPRRRHVDEAAAPHLERNHP